MTYENAPGRKTRCWRGRLEPQAELFIQEAQISPVGFALFISRLARPAFKRADEPVGEDDMRREGMPEPALAWRFRLGSDAEPGIRLPQTHAL